MNCSMLGFLVLHCLPDFSQTHVHWIRDAVQPSHPLSSPPPLALNLSQQQGFFQWVNSLYQVAKVLKLQLQSFQWIVRVDFPWDWDWFDLLAVQGALKSLLQPHSSKPSVLWHSAVFIVHLSHSYMITGKTIALTIQAFVGKVMSLLFNMLSGFVIASFQRSKHLLISGLQSLSTVILKPKKIKCHCFQFFPIYLPWSDETRCHDLRCLNVEF